MLLDSRETWVSTSKEEREDLVHVTIQEVGVDVVAKRILRVRAHPDYEALFSISDRLRTYTKRRSLLECLEVQEDNCDTEADIRQRSTGGRKLTADVTQQPNKREEYII